MTLKILPKKYGVCRLPKTASIPLWVAESDFFSITKTEDELSVVCEEDRIPDDVKVEDGWRMIKVLGPLEFSLIGILSKISVILAEVQVSIFVISTYDTDYILVKEVNLELAVKTLKSKNYTIIE